MRAAPGHQLITSQHGGLSKKAERPTVTTLSGSHEVGFRLALLLIPKETVIVQVFCWHSLDCHAHMGMHTCHKSIPRSWDAVCTLPCESTDLNKHQIFKAKE